MKKILKSFILVVFVSIIFSGPSYAAILWYNGDFNGVDGLANEYGTLVSDARVYDDFVVDGSGWIVNKVWSNNLMDFSAASAMWEIRSGVSSGNAGTLVADGGGTSFFSQIGTGRIGLGYTEYTIAVDGINLYLAPGTYWLSVVPVGSGSGRSFASLTSGANAIGTPAGNNGNAFLNSTYFGYNYAPTTGIPWGATFHDFSMGIDGVAGSPVVPEPASLSFLGLVLLGLFRKRLIAHRS